MTTFEASNMFENVKVFTKRKKKKKTAFNSFNVINNEVENNFWGLGSRNCATG